MVLVASAAPSAAAAASAAASAGAMPAHAAVLLSLLLSCWDSVLLSCSTSESWPSRLRCRVFVSAPAATAAQPLLQSTLLFALRRLFTRARCGSVGAHGAAALFTRARCGGVVHSHTVRVSVAVLLNLTELAKPDEMPRLRCNTQRTGCNTQHAGPRRSRCGVLVVTGPSRTRCRASVVTHTAAAHLLREPR